MELNKIKSKVYSTIFFIKKINLTYLITGLILLCGIILRLKVYFYNQSFWADECSLAINIVRRPFIKLFNPLDMEQVSPPFFMIISKFILLISGQSYNLETRDLILRLFPCFCSIVSLPLFSYFVYKIFNNRYILWIATSMLAFNNTAINYTQEFKQYSCEMMFALILTIAFLNLNLKNISIKKLWCNVLLFMLSMWFSSTACIIICTGFLITFFDAIKYKYLNYKKALILILPLIANVCAYYFLYFRRVNRALSEMMHDYWGRKVLSFFSLDNFHYLFVEKMQRLINFPYPKYLFIFLILSITILFFNKTSKNSCKFYVILPILLAIFASFLNVYPFEQRLILFLLPFFIIIYSQAILLFKENKLVTFTLFALLCSVSINALSKETNQYIQNKNINREFSQILIKNKVPEERIFLTTDDRLFYYLCKDGRCKNKFLRDSVWKNFEESKFKDVVKTLPKGDYWIECTLLYLAVDYNKKLKEFINDAPELKLIQYWRAPYEKDVYLIHFKKIK